MSEVVMDDFERYGWPPDVFEDHNVFAEVVGGLEGGEDDEDEDEATTVASAQELLALLRGWVAAHENDPNEPPERLAWTREMLAELEVLDRNFYLADLEVARADEALEAAQADLAEQEAKLHEGYRSMVFWQGRDAPDVKEAERMIRETCPPETAERILDLTGLFDEDIPPE
jgi:hypothetical protein